MNHPLLWSCLLGAGLLSGCASTGMARIVDPGTFQGSIAPGLVGVRGGNSGLDYQPQFALGARYGVTEGFDVGAGLSAMGYPEYYGLLAQVDVRFALVRAPSLDAGVDLTLAPSLFYAEGIEHRRHVGGELPLLCGFNVGGTQIVLGPRLTYHSNELPTVLPHRGEWLVGTSLGVAFPLSSWARLVPELTVRVPMEYPSQMHLHAGVGLLLGGYAEQP